MYRRPDSPAELTVVEVSRVLGLSEQTVRRMVDEGVFTGAFCTLTRRRLVPCEAVREHVYGPRETARAA